MAIAGTPLEFAELRWPTLGGVSLAGRTVRGTDTYGKHLLTRLDDGRTLRSHFRMDGSWHLRRAPAPPIGRPSAVANGRPGSTGVSHRTRAVLATAQWLAIGNSLGMLDLVNTCQEIDLIGHLGPDILTLTGSDDSSAADSDELPERRTVAATRPKQWPVSTSVDEAGRRIADQGRRPIAEALLDQTVIAGIGTIFCSESLFAVRASPWAAAASIDTIALVAWCRAAMHSSVLVGRTRTTTLGSGRWVHGRLGQPCLRCRAPIAVDTIGRPPLARPGFYCPVCQPDHPAGVTHRPYRR